MNEIEIQELRKAAAGEIFFNRICHSRIEIFKRTPRGAVKHPPGGPELGGVPLKLGGVNPPQGGLRKSLAI